MSLKLVIPLIVLLFLIPIVFSAVVEITIEYGEGPSLQVNIFAPSSAQPNQQISLGSKVTNTGTANASSACLEWTLPSGWTINTGSKTVCISQLSPNAIMWNNITVTTGSTTGSFQITASANCSEGVTNSASVSISVIQCPNGTCDPGETCSNCPQDCSCPNSPGCCGEQCGCPSGQVCENGVCVTPSGPGPGPTPCDPTRDLMCCLSRYSQGCCDCGGLGYSNCYIVPFNSIYKDCKDQCMHVCPRGCSQFTNSSSCINAGCKWYNNACHETFTGSCSDLTDQESCTNTGCYWCEGVCKEKCVLNWNLTISRYLETFVNKPINGTIEIKNIGEKSVTNLVVNFVNISSDVEYQVFPSSYSKISPGETKIFTITFNPKKVGNYEIKVNITSKEVFHVTEINLVVSEAPGWHPELLTMVVLLWVIAGLILMLTVVSYKLYMRRKMKKLKIAEKPKEEEAEYLE